MTQRSAANRVLTLQPVLAESSRVRAALKWVAADLGFSSERSFDIQVAVGEAVANAIEHTHGSGTVRVELTVLSDRLEVTVQGTGEFHLPTPADGRRHRGLGLPLMATLSDHLALYSAAEGGTLVALSFLLPGSAHAAPAVPTPAEFLATSRLSGGTPGSAWGEGESTTWDQADEELANIALFPEENPFPVLRVAEDGRLLYANPAAAPLLRQWRIALGGRVSAAVKRTVAEALASGEQREFETCVEDRRFSVVLVPVVQRAYVNFYGRDITDSRRAEEAREEQHQLTRVLVQLTQAITGTADPATMLELVVAQAAGPLGVESASISLRDGDDWVLVHATGPAAAYLGVRLPSSRTPLSVLACQTGQVQVVEDTRASDLVDRPGVEERKVRAILVARLVMRGEPIGVLAFSHHTAPRRFTPAQIDFAENLAASLSLGLENARLYEAQKHIADTLQTSLLRLPATLPDVDVDLHYRSATEEALVGGDFYDAFPIHRYLAGLVVGDFCGHGVEAASIASVVRDTFRAYAFQGLPLGEVLALTNGAILHQTDMGPYTTVFAAFLNTRTGGLDFCSAGHPPALLRRTNGEVERLEVFGPPLGAFAGTRYHPGRTILHRGETLLLYTDGLIEARAGGSFFGEERLTELFREHAGGVQGLTRSLLDAATSFTKGRLHDDVALLAVALRDAKD